MVSDKKTEQHSKGKSGSQCLKIGDHSYQVKASISANQIEENLSEFISISILQPCFQENLPEVTLHLEEKDSSGQDKVGSLFQIHSKYIAGGVADLDHYDRENILGLSIGEISGLKHRHIHVDEKSSSQKKSLAKTLALDGLAGNHDGHPANKIVYKKTDQGIAFASIDYGKALNGLLKYNPVGQVESPTEQFLDFLNRSYVNSSKILTPSKIWTFYEGFIHSQDFVDACDEIVGKKEQIISNIENTKSKIQGLLSASTPKSKEKIIKVLKNINNRLKLTDISIRHDLREETLIDDFFINIKLFFVNNLRSMEYVSNVMQVQIFVEAMILGEESGHLNRSRLKGALNKLFVNKENFGTLELKFVRIPGEKVAFSGTLDNYIHHRLSVSRKTKETKESIAGKLKGFAKDNENCFLRQQLTKMLHYVDLLRDAEIIEVSEYEEFKNATKKLLTGEISAANWGKYKEAFGKIENKIPDKYFSCKNTLRSTFCLVLLAFTVAILVGSLLPLMIHTYPTFLTDMLDKKVASISSAISENTAKEIVAVGDVIPALSTVKAIKYTVSENCGSFFYKPNPGKLLFEDIENSDSIKPLLLSE